MNMQAKPTQHQTKMLTQEEILGLLHVIQSGEGLDRNNAEDKSAELTANTTPEISTTHESGASGLTVTVDRNPKESSIFDDLGAKTNLRQTATEVLMGHFRPLVVRMAKQYAHVGFEEALQEGYLALLHAIHDYDETLGVPFAGYVFSKVRGDVRTAMRRLWRYEERLSYPTQARDMEADTDTTADWDKQTATASATVETWDDYDSADIRMIIDSAGLSPRERLAILSMLDGQTCPDLALQEGVSSETVKTWRKRALHKLRAALGGEV